MARPEIHIKLLNVFVLFTNAEMSRKDGNVLRGDSRVSMLASGTADQRLRKETSIFVKKEKYQAIDICIFTFRGTALLCAALQSGTTRY